MTAARRERIYLIPRGAGLVLAFTLLLIFGLGFVQPSAREITQALGITLLIAGVVAMIQSNENLRGMEVIGCRATPVAAGENVVLEITVQNRSRSERIGLFVRKGWRWRQAWKQRREPAAWLPVIRGGETATLSLELPPARRGRHRIPTLWISSALPVGLCFAWKTFEKTGDYFVYPKPQGMPLEGEDRSGHGANRKGLEGGSEDVSGHRPYEPGDPLSRMDWRVFARTGKVVVRTLEEGGGSTLDLRWEDTKFLDHEEQRLEQLSYWIAQCVRENRPFRLSLGTPRDDLNHRNVTACLEALATFSEGGKDA